jgi:hypothetical protein
MEEKCTSTNFNLKDEDKRDHFKNLSREALEEFLDGFLVPVRQPSLSSLPLNLIEDVHLQ